MNILYEEDASVSIIPKDLYMFSTLENTLCLLKKSGGNIGS